MIMMLIRILLLIYLELLVSLNNTSLCGYCLLHVKYTLLMNNYNLFI